MADEKSTRTKMIEETKVDEDLSGIKSIIKKGLEAASHIGDKLGITQEKEYANKSKEELAVKKAKGGKVSGYRSVADGIATKGKTRGRFV